MNPIYALSGCAAVSGLMIGSVFLWQEASGADTTPSTSIVEDFL